MMPRLLIPLALLALAGCDASEPRHETPRSDPSQPVPGPNPVRTPPDPQPRPLPAPQSLIGEWRVAGIDGEALSGDVGIAVSIDEASITYEPRCAGFVWDYRYEKGDLYMARRAAGEPASGGGSMVCAVVVPPELIALGNALDVVVRAGRTPANGVLLSGGGHSVTLFSQ